MFSLIFILNYNINAANCQSILVLSSIFIYDKKIY